MQHLQCSIAVLSAAVTDTAGSPSPYLQMLLCMIVDVRACKRVDFSIEHMPKGWTHSLDQQ